MALKSTSKADLQAWLHKGICLHPLSGGHLPLLPCPLLIDEHPHVQGADMPNWSLCAEPKWPEPLCRAAAEVEALGQQTFRLDLSPWGATAG